jgi:hypothetical protein
MAGRTHCTPRVAPVHGCAATLELELRLRYRVRQRPDVGYAMIFASMTIVKVPHRHPGRAVTPDDLPKHCANQGNSCKPSPIMHKEWHHGDVRARRR